MISVSAGADVYAPTLGYLIAMASAAIAVYIGNFIEKKMRVDDAVGAVAVHGFMGFLGMLWVGVFAAGYPTGVNNVDSSIWGQLLGIATFLPLGFLSGYVASLGHEEAEHPAGAAGGRARWASTWPSTSPTSTCRRWPSAPRDDRRARRHAR